MITIMIIIKTNKTKSINNIHIPDLLVVKELKSSF